MRRGSPPLLKGGTEPRPQAKRSDRAAPRWIRPSIRPVLLALVVLPLLAVAGCALRTGAKLPEVRLHVETWTLSNGLTVYALPSHDIPLVTLDMWVGTGAKDEPPELAGISHFLEHMLFKGTPRLGVGDYDRRIEALGGYLNAATSNDYTHYYLTVPSEHLGSAMTDMADVLINSLIDPTEVERERTVILEEIALKQDNPLPFLYDEAIRAAYVTSPYAGTVIGSEETVAAMTRDQIYEHYRRHYAPENMALVISGDFDVAAIRPEIERLFGELDRPFDPWRESPPPTEFAPARSRTWEKDWSETYFLVVFPGIAAQDMETAAAIDVAEGVLFGGRSSRVVNSLREKRRLVRSLGAFFHAGRHPGVFAIYGTTDPERIDEAIDALFEELDAIRAGGPTSSELARSRRQIVTAHLYSMETNTGRASAAGYSHVLLGNTELLTDYPRVVDGIRRRDLQSVFDLLQRENASIYVARPAAVAVR